MDFTLEKGQIDKDATDFLKSLVAPNLLLSEQNWLIYGSKEGVFIETETGLHGFKAFPFSKLVKQSKDGKLIAAATEGKVLVSAAEDLVKRIDVKPVELPAEALRLHFSPKGRFLVVSEADSVKVFDVQTRKVKLSVPSFLLPKSGGKSVWVSSDEQVVWVLSDPRRIRKFELSGGEFREAKTFELGSGSRVSNFHLLAGDRLLILSVACRTLFFFDRELTPMFDLELPGVFSEAEVRLNRDKDRALVTLSDLIDATSKSYYGTSTLHLLDLKRFSLIEIPRVRGPLHCAAWRSDGQEILLISGELPAHVVLADSYGRPKRSLGKLFRNTGQYSLDADYLWAAGMASLSGDMTVWDLNTFARVGEMKTQQASNVRFLPDGRRLLLSVEQQKLRNQNHFRLVAIDGTELRRKELDDEQLFFVRPLRRS